MYERAGGQVVIAADDGSKPRVLAAGFAPRVSPDGRHVGFLRGSATTAVVPASGGPSRTLLRSRDRAFFPPVWSPDSRAVVPPTIGALFVVPLAGKAKRHRAGPCGNGAEAAFAPDGRSLVYSVECLDGGALHRLSLRGGRSVALGDGHAAVWGRAGIVWADDDATRYDRGTSGEVWFAPRQGPRRRIWRSAQTGVRPVAWAPDARHVLVTTPAPSHRRYAGLLDTASGRMRMLAPEFLEVTGLSADGKRVLGVFGVPRDNAVGDVVSVPVDGGPARVLATNARYPSWSMPV